MHSEHAHPRTGALGGQRTTTGLALAVSAPVVGAILACASDDSFSLLQLLPRLNALGMNPRVVAGIDAEPGRLAEALRAATEPTLVVLCASSSLNPEQVEACSAMYRDHRRGNHWVVTVQLDERRPSRTLPRIQSGAEELRERLASVPLFSAKLRGYMRSSSDAAAVAGVCAAKPQPTASAPRTEPLVVAPMALRFGCHTVARPAPRPRLRLLSAAP